MAKRKKESIKSDSLIIAGVLVVFTGIGLALAIEEVVKPYTIPIFIGLGLIASGFLKKPTEEE